VFQRFVVVLMAASLACGGSRSKTSPDPQEPKTPAVPLQTAPLAGQPTAVLPLTLVAPDTSLARGELFRRRDRLLAWADSIIEDRLSARAPEVTWTFPEELRRVAQRAAGVVSDPDKMGQAVMRAEGLEIVPDPLRSQLRSLVAVAGGRFVFIPASVLFRQPEPGTVEAHVMMVLVDARTGAVVWRSLARSRAGSPALALGQALDETFPLQTGAP